MSVTHGNHGYDNQYDSMKAIFYASGPEFKRNFTLDKNSSLYNVDLFGLMCLILNLDDCPPSNGTLEHIQPFLSDPNRVENMRKRIKNRRIKYIIFSISKS